jgi:hypothetical protein
MKNLYFLAAVAAFVLGSCTVEEALDPPADPEDEARAIGFGTFLDRAPQNGIKPLASIMNINSLKTRGFIVEAYKHATTDWNGWNDGARTTAPNFMDAKPVTWSGGTSTSASWRYSPIKYWPRSDSDWDKVSLFAYTPSPTSGTTVTFAPAKAADVNKNPKLHYSMSTDNIRHTDLIVDAKYNAQGSANNKVEFKFDHVLSRIGFQVKKPESHGATSITLTSLTFFYNRLHISGTYTFNSGTATNSSDKDNKALGNWSTIGASTTTSSNILFNSSATLTTNPLNLSENIAPPRYLMLIPQENAYGQAYVQVSYTIHYPDSYPPTQNNSAAVPLPAITSWEPGKAYTYTLNIVAPKEMIFHVSEGEDCNDWEPEEPDDIFYPSEAGNGEGGTGNGKNPFSVFR